MSVKIEYGCGHFAVWPSQRKDTSDEKCPFCARTIGMDKLKEYMQNGWVGDIVKPDLEGNQVVEI